MYQTAFACDGMRIFRSMLLDDESCLCDEPTMGAWQNVVRTIMVDIANFIENCLASSVDYKNIMSFTKPLLLSCNNLMLRSQKHRS